MESTTRSQKQNERCGVAGTQLGLLWLWLTTVTQEFDNVRKIIVLQPNLLSIVGVEYNRACNSSSGRKHIKRNEDTNRLETMPRVKCGVGIFRKGGIFLLRLPPMLCIAAPSERNF